MDISAPNVKKKPYDRCIPCGYLGANCDGPNPLAMVKPDEEHPLARLSEWCRKRKEFLHEHDPIWTNAYIADCAQTAKVTVDRFLSGKLDDIKLSTLSRIFKVLVNGSWGEYPCAIDINTEELAECQKQLEALERDNASLKFQLADMTKKKDHFKQLSEEWLEQLHTADQNYKDRKEFLRSKDREIKFWKILSFILIGILILALIALVYAFGTDAIITL